MEESYRELDVRHILHDWARSEDERRASAESSDRLAKDLAKYTQFTLRPPPASGRLTCQWIGPTLHCEPY
jgi:hypothetical protein